MMNALILAAGFALLIKGADLLVDGAAAIARRFNISELVIGLTVVAFGTSAPELFVNILAGITGNTDIAIGNVLGSNIANVLLILGVSALIFPLAVSGGTVWKEIPFSLLAAVILGIMANDRLIDGSSVSALTRTDGLVLLGFFVVFLYYSAGIAQPVSGMSQHVPGPAARPGGAVLRILGGLAALLLGGKWIVDAAVAIAAAVGLSQSVIGLTVVAVGTSLPELATSIVAALKKNVDIAVGNVVGSNIFNIFFILGVSALVRPLPFRESANADVMMAIAASLMLFVTMFTGKRRVLDRWEGALFLVAYIAYVGWLLTVR
jgi:cation:H+ antiporter